MRFNTFMDRGNVKHIGREKVPAVLPENYTLVNDEESEGEKQLKQLVKNQLDTNVTLESQLKKRKTFTTGTRYKALNDEVAGKVDLIDYSQLTERDRQVDELRHCGLTEQEIRLKLDEDNSQPKKRRYGAEPSVSNAREDEINKIIQEKKLQLSKPDKFSGVKCITRQDLDLEKSVSRDQDRAKLLSCLVTTERERSDFDDERDPINHLDSIWEEVRENIGADEKARFIGPLPKTAYKNDGTCHVEADKVSYETTQIVESSRINNDCVSSSESCEISKRTESDSLLSDNISDSVEIKESVLSHSNLPAKCDNIKTSDHDNEKLDVMLSDTLTTAVSSRDNLQCPVTLNDSTGQTGIRTLSGEMQSIPRDVIHKYRLTLEDIKSLPRFKDYTPGEPSKTLFLKNLAAKVREEDLVALFMRFQKPESSPIIYKLLTGRMKGQAFVTFDCVEIATNALELVNGYRLKGKPIIIQYGRNRSQTGNDKI